MNEKNFVSIDFETATHQRAACQIGIAVVKDGIITERISRLICPPYNEYSPKCSAVHHIYPEDTENSPTFDKVWKEIKHYFKGLVVAHNAAFDLDVLEKNLKMYHLRMPTINSVCTYQLTGMSLQQACESYNIPLDNHHDGACDAEACALLYLKYLDGETLPPKERVIHKAIQTSLFVQNFSADPNNPLYEKKVVITGLFSIERNEIADKVSRMGAKLQTAINQNTDIVIIGEEPGPAKIKALDNLIKEGHPIVRLNEQAILEIIGKYDFSYKAQSPLGVRVFLSGTFGDKKGLIKTLSKNGATMEPLSKETCVIIAGRDRDEYDLIKQETLAFDGYHIPVITDTDVTKILSREIKAQFPVPVKNLDITYNRLFKSRFSPVVHFNFCDIQHSLGEKEIFIYKPENKWTLRQALGNIGAYDSGEFDPLVTDFCLLTTGSIMKLKLGLKDECIQLITDTYNKSNSTKFTYRFILEPELVLWLEHRARYIGDNVSLSLILRYKEQMYMESIATENNETPI